MDGTKSDGQQDSPRRLVIRPVGDRTPCEPIADELAQMARHHWWKFNHIVLREDGFEVVTEDQGGWPFVGFKLAMTGKDETVRAAALAAMKAIENADF